MRLFTHAESGQLTYTPLSLDTAKHSRYILSTMLYTQKKNPPPSNLKLRARARAQTQVKFTAGSGSVQKVLFEMSWIYETFVLRAGSSTCRSGGIFGDMVSNSCPKDHP